VTCAISCKEGEEDESEECLLIALFLILIVICATLSGAYLSIFFTNMSVDVFGRQLHPLKGIVRGPPSEGFA